MVLPPFYYEEAGNENIYNIPREFQRITGMSIREFMQLGMVLSSARQGPYKTPGILNQSWIDKGIEVGINVLKKDKIQNFRTTAERDQFKIPANNYILYEFNPLSKYPFVKIHPERWVAPNPDLVIARVTSGIYYDLLDDGGKSFTDNFGPIFEKYIGKLIGPVYSKEKILKEKEVSHYQN